MELALAGLVFLLVVLVVGTVFVVVRVVELVRAARTALQAIGRGLDEVAQALDRLAAQDPPELDRLTASLDRLRTSRARLAILTSALGRVRDQWSAYAAAYPRK